MSSDIYALLRQTASFAGADRALSSSPCWTCSPGGTPPTPSPSCDPDWSGIATTDTLTARPGAQRLAVTSGGTIPDRGLFAVHIAGGGGRVGELDEEMVYESRVGDTIALGRPAGRSSRSPTTV